MNKFRYSIALFIGTMSFYFINNIGVPIPVFFLAFCIYPKFVVKSLKNFTYIYIFVFLGSVQIFLGISPLNEFFMRKVFGILLFYYSFFLIIFYYSEKYIKYIKYSLIITFIYAIYSAPSYLIGYQDYLIPGTCPDNNISPFGLLRCSTFGEGNYFGTYSALMGILFIKETRFFLIALICSFISFSPIPILVNLYLFFTRHSRINVNIFYSLFFLGAVFTGLMLFIYGAMLIPSDIKAAWDSPLSSISERLEFIRAGALMWLDQPILGIGLGQFGNNLHNYTDFNHFIYNASNGLIRYIPNNVFSETLSEQGLIGFLVLCFFFKNLHDHYSGPLYKNEFMILIIFLLMTVPTLYQIVLGVIFALLCSRSPAVKVANFNSGAKLN